MADRDQHLPDAVVKAIAGYLVQNESSGNRLLYLVAMCGVCKHWRSMAREVPEDTVIAFDGLDTALSTQATLYRFRKLPMKQKQQVFQGAAKLLTGVHRQTSHHADLVVSNG